MLQDQGAAPVVEDLSKNCNKAAGAAGADNYHECLVLGTLALAGVEQWLWARLSRSVEQNKFHTSLAWVTVHESNNQSEPRVTCCLFFVTKILIFRWRILSSKTVLRYCHFLECLCYVIWYHRLELNSDRSQTGSGMPRVSRVSSHDDLADHSTGGCAVPLVVTHVPSLVTLEWDAGVAVTIQTMSTMLLSEQFIWDIVTSVRIWQTWDITIRRVWKYENY